MPKRPNRREIIPRTRVSEDVLRTAILRDFDGGFDYIDNDLNLSPRYAKQLNNMILATDGGIRIRGGLKKIVNLVDQSITSNIVNGYFFMNHYILVLTDGTIVKYNPSTDTLTTIWDNTIATTAGASAGWSATDFACFDVFGGKLIVCNGVNKPLRIDLSATVPCIYLVDEGSNSNINIPNARYVTSVKGYLILAGDTTNPSKLWISAYKTSGTFEGDPPPNDACTIMTGVFAPTATPVIKGLARFRDTLIVAYDECIVVGILGIYTGAVHTPSFTDNISNHGTISNRTIINLGEDLLMCDSVGIPSLVRAQLTGALRPDRVSHLIDPLIQGAISNLTNATQEKRIFAVNNAVDNQYMLFIPNENTVDTTTETVGFVLTMNRARRIMSWSRFHGWNLVCGFSVPNRSIILCDKTCIYSYELDQPYDETDENVEEVPIRWLWEMPWFDYRTRESVKNVRYFGVEAIGTALFNVSIFGDNVYDRNRSYIENFDGSLADDSDVIINYDLDGGNANDSVTPIEDYNGGIAYAPEARTQITLSAFDMTKVTTQEEFNSITQTALSEYNIPCAIRARITKLVFSGQSTTPLKIVSMRVSYQLGKNYY